MNERTRPLAEALTSTDPKMRALIMEIEALEPGFVERLASALLLDRALTAKPN